jgi:DNA-binding NtrC family response regulator
MSNRPSRVLIVDDEESIVQALTILFRGRGYTVIPAVGGEAGLSALESQSPDLVVSDIRMPGVTGMDILVRAQAQDPGLPVILITAQASLQSAMQAVNQGAFYYIQKPFVNDELLAISARAIETRQLRSENQELRREARRQGSRDRTEPVGRAPAFRAALELARTVAPTDSTVLITGESGTGKEVVARYIHERSNRSEGPFLSVNCGALPESLLESELFGHVKGSFTGAFRDKAGLLVAAAGGTLLLDEVGEMSAKTQVKLLRALQEREVLPVGATQPVPMDVRLLAATHRDLEEAIRKGDFRSDLYYRLNVIHLELPALRARRDDIPLLVDVFLRRIAPEGEEPRVLSETAMEAMLAYDWPGNVRELENALERAAILSRNVREIPLDALPERVRERQAPSLVAEVPPPNPPMEAIERAYIAWVLQAEGGNRARAAEVLGIDPSTLYRKIARYGLGEGGA